jgi:hypothetical protein
MVLARTPSADAILSLSKANREGKRKERKEGKKARLEMKHFLKQ